MHQVTTHKHNTNQQQNKTKQTIDDTHQHAYSYDSFLPLLLSSLFSLFLSLSMSSPCPSEDVLAGELLIGDYTVSPPDGRVSVSVVDPTSSNVYSKTVQSEGKFAHTASKPGEYRMCFHNSEGVSQKTIGLTLSSGGRDYKEMAKKDNLKPLELELKRLEDTIVQIHQEMKFLQAREAQMRETNDSTSSRVVWFSVLSMIVLVLLNAGQILYLKKYFQGKKLIQ